MTASGTFAAFLFAVALPRSGASSVRLAPGGATAEAILALDTDKSGKVERSEVEAFAKSQGLSAEDVRAEFAELDKNGDGELGADEISQTLNEQQFAGAPEAPPVVVASSVAPPSVAEPPSAVAKVVTSASGIVAGLAVYSPTTQVQHATLAAPLSIDGTLEFQALVLEAQQHAGKALAEVFARTASKALEARSQDAAKAEKLEETAKALRGKTSLLKKTATEQTVEAAKAAAEAVLKEASVKVKRLDQQAAAMEQQATDKRKQAKEAMAKALQAQAGMTSSMQSLKQQ